MRKLVIAVALVVGLSAAWFAAPASSQSLEGTLVVTKIVEGPVPPGTEFLVEVDCPPIQPTDGGGEAIENPRFLTFDEEGGSQTLPVFIFASECTITEIEDGGAETVTYGGEDIPGGCDVTASETNVVADFIEPVTCEVTITNTFVEAPPAPEPPAAQIVEAQPAFTG
jgi:hypothetical protein